MKGTGLYVLICCLVLAAWVTGSWWFVLLLVACWPFVRRA